MSARKDTKFLATEHRKALKEIGWGVGPLHCDKDGRCSFRVTMPDGTKHTRAFLTDGALEVLRDEAGLSGRSDDPNFLRADRFTPYRSGMGPTFTLEMYATGRYDDRGQEYIHYKLYRVEGRKRELLFEGSDYSPSPMYAIDSKASMLGLMSFLALQPGDTDDEYFEKYTARQRQWAESGEAEQLSYEVSTQEEALERRSA